MSSTVADTPSGVFASTGVVSSPSSTTPPKKAKRARWTGDALRELEASFNSNQHPSVGEMERLGTKLEAEVASVKSWFANRRTKEKRNADSAPSTTTTSSAPDEMEDLKSELPLAGTPKSHLPILETDIPTLHARIKALEAENAELKRQLAKRQREETVTVEPVAKKKKTGKSDVEKLFHAWGKRLSVLVKTVKFHDSYSLTEVVVEESLTKELFEQCFAGKGEVIQPTKDNKPKSKVWIISFKDWEAIEQLFGTGNIKHDGHIAWLWAKGGVPRRGFGFFGGGGGFSKSEKLGKGQATVVSLEVHYNEVHSKLQLKFQCRYVGRSDVFGAFYDSD